MPVASVNVNVFGCSPQFSLSTPWTAGLTTPGWECGLPPYLITAMCW